MSGRGAAAPWTCSAGVASIARSLGYGTGGPARRGEGRGQGTGAAPGSSGLAFPQPRHPAEGVREGGRGRSGALRRARALAALSCLLRCPLPSLLSRAEEARRPRAALGVPERQGPASLLPCALSVLVPGVPARGRPRPWWLRKAPLSVGPAPAFGLRCRGLCKCFRGHPLLQLQGDRPSICL